MSHYGVQIKGTSPIIKKSPFLSVHAEGGRIGLKEGGDSNWIQKCRNKTTAIGYKCYIRKC
jgi:hypothetical protein